MPVIGVLISAVVAFATRVGAAFALEIGAKTILWLAAKALILFLIFTAIPILMFNFGMDFLLTLAQYGVSYVGGVSNLDAQVVQITGLGAWIGSHMQVDTALSMILSAVSIRFCLHLMRL